MIVVTGGAGFIGSALIARLNSRDITDIIVVDRLGTDGKWKNLRNLRFADYYEKDDFLRMVAENKLPSQIKTIFHLGANSSTTETDASYLVKNNYEYTKILCQWAANSDVRFIYASSAATYGDGSLDFSDNEEEIDKLRPLNMYGYSKQMFDMWAKKAELFDSIVGLKYFNVFGPNEYHKGAMRSFVLKAFEQIRETGKVKLFKSHKPRIRARKTVKRLPLYRRRRRYDTLLYGQPRCEWSVQHRNGQGKNLERSGLRRVRRTREKNENRIYRYARIYPQPVSVLYTGGDGQAEKCRVQKTGTLPRRSR